MVWFNDVRKLEIERIEYFKSNSDGGYDQEIDGYVCAIVMANGYAQTFFSLSETDIKHLAAAFSLETRLPVGTVGAFGKVGVKVSGRDGVIVEMLYGGPFDIAGIPVGSKIIGIDGANVDARDIIGKLDSLTAGGHKIDYAPPAQITSKKSATIELSELLPPI